MPGIPSAGGKKKIEKRQQRSRPVLRREKLGTTRKRSVYSSVPHEKQTVVDLVLPDNKRIASTIGGAVRTERRHRHGQGDEEPEAFRNAC